MPDKPITSLRGIGAARAEAFAKLGVKTVGDLLYLLPRSLLWKARWQEEYMTLCLTLLASGALEAIRAIQKRSRTRK